MPYWQATVAGMPEGGIMPMPPGLPAEVPPNWIVYFGAENTRRTVEVALKLGATVEAEPMEAADITFAILSDPVGGTFGVMEPPK